MAIATSINLERLQTGERPQYGSPYPEGIAVAHSQITGDASGGIITWTILSDGGFLFRLEGIQIAIGTTTIDVVHMITSHRWASDKSGLGTTSFDLNWGLGFYLAASGFQVASLTGNNQTSTIDALTQVRKLPMGRSENVSAQQVMFVTVEGNIDTIDYQLAAWCTYWRKESLYLPGFLESFYESPVVPPLRRI